jgi:hypothetical protein
MELGFAPMERRNPIRPQPETIPPEANAQREWDLMPGWHPIPDGWFRNIKALVASCCSDLERMPLMLEEVADLSAGQILRRRGQHVSRCPRCGSLDIDLWALPPVLVDEETTPSQMVVHMQCPPVTVFTGRLVCVGCGFDGTGMYERESPAITFGRTGLGAWELSEMEWQLRIGDENDPSSIVSLEPAANDQELTCAIFGSLGRHCDEQWAPPSRACIFARRFHDCVFWPENWTDLVAGKTDIAKLRTR